VPEPEARASAGPTLAGNAGPDCARPLPYAPAF